MVEVTLEKLNFETQNNNVEFIDREESQSERPELSTARVVISEVGVYKAQKTLNF